MFTLPACLPALALLACGGDEPSAPTDAGTTTPSATPTPTVPDVTCDPPGRSSCADDGSVVRGVAWAGPDGPTSGDLVVYLTHLDLGEEDLGGFYHTSATWPGVDLADGPIVFEVDMCAGGEMWPTDYGDYNLVVILDQDGDNDPAGFASNQLPDPGEPSARLSPVRMEQGAEAPCFDDVVLDCTDGADCVAYAP